MYKKKGQLEVKTQIAYTTKNLIILFISSSFLIWYIKLLDFCILQSLILISTSRLFYLYHLKYASFMVPELAYTSRSFYISTQVRFKLTYWSDLRATGLYIKDFCDLVNSLTFITSIIRTLALTKLLSV